MFNLGSRTHRRAVRAVTASPALLERPDAAAVPGLALAVPGAAGVVLTLGLAHGNQACQKEQAGNEKALHGDLGSSKKASILKMGSVLFLQILRFELSSLRWLYMTMTLLHQMIAQKWFVTNNLNCAKLFISRKRSR